LAAIALAFTNYKIYLNLFL